MRSHGHGASSFQSERRVGSAHRPRRKALLVLSFKPLFGLEVATPRPHLSSFSVPQFSLLKGCQLRWASTYLAVIKLWDSPPSHAYV